MTTNVEVEELAIKLHNAWIEEAMRKGMSARELIGWGDLDEKYREGLRTQARRILNGGRVEVQE